MACTRRFFMFCLILVGVVATGCSSNALMPTPSVVSVGLVDPHRVTVEEFKTNTVPVFIAAPRELAERPGRPGEIYTNERSRVVRLARAAAEIGRGMTWEEVAAESRAERRKRNPRVELVSVEDYGTMWNSHLAPNYHFTRDYDFADVDRAASDRWIGEINDQLNMSRRKQIFIYVHGFNTKFDKNTRICAEFWHYMGRDGVMMSFDWPSKGSVFSYQTDKANSEVGIRQFRTLLEFLASESDADRINIIAHSAGTRIVAEALRDLSLRYYDLPDEEAQAKTRIGRVVLAAPDMDFWVAMSAAADGLGRVAEDIIGYASSRDKALGLSSSIFGDVRLGRSIGKLPQDMVDRMVQNGSGWVDATAAQDVVGSFLGHSYYHANPMVSSDIMLYLVVGATPEDRGLVRDTETGFLTFPDDYEERLPEVVEALIEKYAWRPDAED